MVLSSIRPLLNQGRQKLLTWTMEIKNRLLLSGQKSNFQMTGWPMTTVIRDTHVSEIHSSTGTNCWQHIIKSYKSVLNWWKTPKENNEKSRLKFDTRHVRVTANIWRCFGQRDQNWTSCPTWKMLCVTHDTPPPQWSVVVIASWSGRFFFLQQSQGSWSQLIFIVCKLWSASQQVLDASKAVDMDGDLVLSSGHNMKINLQPRATITKTTFRPKSKWESVHQCSHAIRRRFQDF